MTPQKSSILCLATNRGHFHTWNLWLSLFCHPPCFLQKLGLEVRGECLSTRLHCHQSVVSFQASTEYFTKVPLKWSQASNKASLYHCPFSTQGYTHLVSTPSTFSPLVHNCSP